jgi:hypothetical protein
MKNAKTHTPGLDIWLPRLLLFAGSGQMAIAHTPTRSVSITTLTTYRGSVMGLGEKVLWTSMAFMLRSRQDVAQKALIVMDCVRMKQKDVDPGID